MHTNSILLFRKYALPLLSPGTRVLEIGPDRFPSTLQVETQGIEFETWDTLDLYESENLTYPASKPYEYDIATGTYDCVISVQVLAHVEKPWRWMPEVARVLKPGGTAITIAAVSWTFMKALPDYWRVYPGGLKALYEDAGLVSQFESWESLEAPGYRRHFPGVSKECQSPNQRLFYALLGPLGLPVERAYDTIAIAAKPEARAS